MESPLLKFHTYDKNSHVDRTDYYDQYVDPNNPDKGKRGGSWPTVLGNNGATYLRFWHKEISKSVFNNFVNTYPWNGSDTARYNAWVKLLNGQDLSSISLSPIISMRNYSNNHIAANRVTYFPYITMKQQNNFTFGGEGAYLLIQGSILYHDEVMNPHPINDGKDNGHLKRDVDCKRGEEMYVVSRLKWGDKYFNG